VSPLEGPDFRDIRTARVNATTTAGDNTLLTATPGRSIRVYGYQLVAAGAAGVVTIKDGAGTVLATLNLPVGTPVPYVGGSTAPAFEGGVGQSLVLTTAPSQTVTGHLAYYLLAS
jgi:hypothetical protein